MLSGRDVEQFRSAGFLKLDAFVDQAAVCRLRSAYDAMLSGEVDCGSMDRRLGLVTRQIMQPNFYAEAFRSNEAIEAGREVAKLLLGVADPALAFSMLIYKEPGNLAETPWHQDFAYSEMPFAAAGRNIPYDESVQFWIALDEVDERNGCMHFLPGGHLHPLYPHFVAGGTPDDPARLLAIRHPERMMDLSTVVACRLRAGGATVHSFGTPHYTGGNRTADRPRRAYILNFARRGLGSLVGARPT